MAANEYDVIVVGARCAGSPTAMLLAQKGYRVLVVDRTTFPSDTVSTHVMHPTGVDALRRWDLLPAVIASGCPAIQTYAFDFGPLKESREVGESELVVARDVDERAIGFEDLGEERVDEGAEGRVERGERRGGGGF